ncbi:MAG TPA: hypothetical protein VKY32_05110 [Flavobacterium sp.]|nr:hypothetical protein [Flavobacterium sp.]
MKNVLKFLGASVLLLFVVTACSKDDDPSDNDLFVGTYNGSIHYTSDSENKSSDDGKVTVVKVGNKYNFAFSDGIPNINGIEFEEEDDNYYINIGGNELSYIRINESDLKIFYSTDGQTWEADCSR